MKYSKTMIRLNAVEARNLIATIEAPTVPATAAARAALRRYQENVVSDVNPFSHGQKPNSQQMGASLKDSHQCGLKGF